MSGEVDDNTAQSIGRMVGAQTIILGSFTEIANMHRLTIRALEVETAVVQGLFNQTISNAQIIKAFTGRESTIGTGTRSGLYIDGEYQGAMDLLDAVSWINRNARNRSDYTIVIGKDEVIPPISLSTGNRRISVTLRSDGPERIITYNTPSRPSASLFTIGTGVTFNLEEGIALVGLPVDSRPLMRVKGGVFIMNGGVIRDNHLSITTTPRSGVLTWSAGEAEGGAIIIESGTFVLNNGLIKNNFATEGGGVSIKENASFIMNGGTISNNSAMSSGSSGGGGVIVSGTFTMRGGVISDNYAGGVVVNGLFEQREGGIFTLQNGVIKGNSGRSGVNVFKGNFIMQGGTISGNSGGVYISYYNARFSKTGGVIYGSDAPKELANFGDVAYMLQLNGGWVRLTTSRENDRMGSDYFFQGWEAERRGGM
jgi:hypothetical protein